MATNIAVGLAGILIGVLVFFLVSMQTSSPPIPPQVESSHTQAVNTPVSVTPPVSASAGELERLAQRIENLEKEIRQLRKTLETKQSPPSGVPEAGTLEPDRASERPLSPKVNAAIAVETELRNLEEKLEKISNVKSHLEKGEYREEILKQVANFLELEAPDSDRFITTGKQLADEMAASDEEYGNLIKQLYREHDGKWHKVEIPEDVRQRRTELKNRAQEILEGFLNDNNPRHKLFKREKWTYQLVHFYLSRSSFSWK